MAIPTPTRSLVLWSMWAGMQVLWGGIVPAETMQFSLQTRDAQDHAQKARLEVDASRVGVVVVDMWNWHWCKTATMRVDAMVPRMNQALSQLRRYGMTVMLCPSDVVDNYVGWPQREIIFAMPRHPVPPLQVVHCPAPPDGGGCACGRERCTGNYGWDGMHPQLHIDAHDLMPDTLEEVYSICRERDLTHLLYMGVHTQVCLLGKPMGLRNLKSAGLTCILCRDLTDAHPGYAPERGFTPDSHTDEVVRHFERYLAPTINLAEELVKRGDWDPAVLTEPVRVTPWGTRQRPHLFEEEVIVTLSSPWQPGTEIRYTIDGSAPHAGSELYDKPLRISQSTDLRAGAFAQGKQVSTISEGAFVRLPSLPGPPDIHLSELTPIRSVGPGHTYGGTVRYSAHSQGAQLDATNEGKPLRLHGKEYRKGIGVHAPNQLMYAIKPEYRRFVGQVGVDEWILETSNGSNLARHPSVIFKVFVDGKELASSPIMRVATIPWRFEIALPAGAERLSLATMDAGDGSKEDRANWVECGFQMTPDASSRK